MCCATCSQAPSVSGASLLSLVKFEGSGVCASSLPPTPGLCRAPDPPCPLFCPLPVLKLLKPPHPQEKIRIKKKIDYGDTFEGYINQLLYSMSFSLGWFDVFSWLHLSYLWQSQKWGYVLLIGCYQVAQDFFVPLLGITLIIGLKWCLHCKVTFDTYSLFILKIMYICMYVVVKETLDLPS